jgi:ATPase subunit of ABC transporter with duplicated ATPase domains
METNKPGSNLSGGEMVRLIMAMITTFPIDLLIMDEPTNNLDVETIEVLTKSINNFRGAVIVISHNIDFINKINIKTAYIIRNNKLKPMKADPGHKETFYKALTEL